MLQPAAPETVTLPGAPIPLTRIVLGTMSFGDTADIETARRVMDYVLDVGITAIDTANTYDEATCSLADQMPAYNRRHKRIGKARAWSFVNMDRSYLMGRV